MNRNRLLIAVVVLLGLTGAVVSTMRSHEAETTLEKPKAELPKLKKDDITSVEISSPGKPAVTLAKQDGGWVMTAPVSAKADQSAVDSVLEKLGDLEVTDVAATRKENYERLEVDDAHAVHVVAKGGDKVLADLYVGAGKPSGTMVRAAGQEPVLAVRGSIRYVFDKEVKLFRDRVITDVDGKDLTALSLSSAKGNFKFEKPKDGKWAQTKGEKAIPRFSDAKVQSLSSTLGRLRAADFAEASESPEAAGFDAPTATAVLSKADGTSLTLQLGKEHVNGHDYYVRLVGNPLIFRIPKFTAERMLADAAAFQEPEKKAGSPEANAPTAPDMGGTQQIPPEVLKQLQQQLGQKMGNMGAH